MVKSQSGISPRSRLPRAPLLQSINILQKVSHTNFKYSGVVRTRKRGWVQFGVLCHWVTEVLQSVGHDSNKYIPGSSLPPTKLIQKTAFFRRVPPIVAQCGIYTPPFCRRCPRCTFVHLLTFFRTINTYILRTLVQLQQYTAGRQGKM